jgi:hypothetical protein
MGFLDHSTNNIIIDAVLTDYGRRLLAEGSGDFVISSFSLADDEVDYGLITKYGRPVGKEKIAKNTPIFEAQTKGSSAIKHRMITLPNPAVTRIPTIAFQNPTQESSGIVSVNRIQGNFQPLEISLKQSVTAGSLNPDGLTDTLFTVFVNSRFLEVQLGTPLSEEPVTRVSAFSIESNAAAAGFSFTLQAKNITNETFTQYGITQGAATVITTPVTVVGNQTGIRKDFKITLSNQDS